MLNFLEEHARSVYFSDAMLEGALADPGSFIRKEAVITIVNSIQKLSKETNGSNSSMHTAIESKLRGIEKIINQR